MKVFIDTNVLIDYVCQREEFQREAFILFDLAYAGKICIAVSALSFINAYYIGSKIIQYQQLLDYLKELMTKVEVVDFNQSVLRSVFRLSVKDFEDASQYFSATICRADYIVTRNKKDFPFSQIRVLTPKEFLAQVL